MNKIKWEAVLHRAMIKFALKNKPAKKIKKKKHCLEWHFAVLERSHKCQNCF